MNVSIKTFKSHLVSRTSCPLTILIPRRYGWNEWTLKSHTIFLPLCHKMWVLKKKLQEEEKLAPGPGVTSENHEVLLCLLVSVTHRCCHRRILLRLFGTKAPERPRLREKRRNWGKKRPSMEGETSTPTKQGYAVGIFWSSIFEATQRIEKLASFKVPPKH